MSERERFEKWISRRSFGYSLEVRPDDSPWENQYRSHRVQLAWEAWQAALELKETEER